MKGDIAVPSVKTINVANRSKKKIMGARSHFFLFTINSKNSDKIESLDMIITLYRNSSELIFVGEITFSKIVFRSLDLVRFFCSVYSSTIHYHYFLILENHYPRTWRAYQSVSLKHNIVTIVLLLS